MTAQKTLVLSIDGGGIRGIVPLVILETIEKYFIPCSIGEYFDFGAGTSTGSIIIAWLFSNGQDGMFNNSSDLLDKYINHAASIFQDDTILGNVNVKGLLKCLYSNTGLNRLLHCVFANKLMSDLEKECIFPAFNLETKRGFIFGSGRSSNYNGFGIANSNSILIKDAVLASCSAPYYFPVHEFNISEKPYRFVDGGVFANNPLMEAVLELNSQEKYRKKLANHEIFFLSLGTGIFENDFTVKNQSGFNGWIRKENLPKVFLNASSTSIDRYFETYIESVGMPENNYIRLNPSLPEKFKLFDFKDEKLITQLIIETRSYLDENNELLNKLKNFLSA